MKITFKRAVEADATHIVVNAGVRYWEDAKVNGIIDEDGTLIPGRAGDSWRANINLDEGRIENWPEGTTAKIHYKVCDDGEYWLTDHSGQRLVYRQGYVPNDFLCHGDNGYGDYIIINIGPDGKIADYSPPSFDPQDWEPAA